MAVSLANDTQQAFDSVAADYDRSNAENALLREMRRRTLDCVRPHLRPGARVLDLGCGPGTDLEALASLGCAVTGIDQSPRMVEEARRRVGRAGLGDLVEVRHLSIDQLDRLPERRFDVVYSDFGPLNCVDDLAATAGAIARRLSEDGVVVASVIGRVCPWELGLYLSRGDLGRACVRFASGPVAVPLNGHTVWTRYYLPAEFERACGAAGLRRVWIRSLGLVTPPPYMQAFAERHPRLIRTLQRIEDRVASWPLVRQCGDHFLIVLDKA